MAVTRRIAGLVVALSLGFLVAASAAIGGDPDGRRPMPPHPRGPHDGRGPHDAASRDERGPHDGRSLHEAHGLLGPHAERLGLDDETRAAIREIVEQSRSQGEALRAKVDEARGEMRRLLGGTDVEEAAVMRQAETIGALEIEEHKNRLRAMLRIRSLLTPEQRKKLMDIREEMFAGVFERTREACAADIARLCPDAADDAAKRDCMRRRRHEISAPCRDAVAAELAKRRHEAP